MDSRGSLVDLIFAKCTLVYGRDFLDRWSGLDLDEVKADWGRELQHVLDRPQAVRHALEHLPPGKAPNVLEFRALCAMPEQPVKRLPAPRADSKVVAAALKGVKRAMAGDPKAWAYELKAREGRGDKLTRAQRDMWRSAIGVEEPEEEFLEQ